MTPMSLNVSNGDSWIDQELESLRESVEPQGEIASIARTAPLPQGSARGGDGRIAPRLRNELHARGFDVVVGVAAVLGSIALGALIPLLLR